MPLTETAINKAVDVDTFGRLAEAVAARMAAVPAQRIIGEQRLNSLLDAITVDAVTGHYKAASGDALPAVRNHDYDRINSTVDTYRLEHLVAYLVSKDIAVAVPVNTVPPVIAGTGSGPFTVTSEGTWTNTPDSWAYQWFRDAAEVVDAVTAELADDPANVGASITCQVQGINEAGMGVAVASNAIVGA